uniref:Uncharacterized protein n=1 Tax=Rhizophora mucronata TaxID=61149 RepID=A0A2P2NUR7_RHIMU
MLKQNNIQTLTNGGMYLVVLKPKQCFHATIIEK